VLLSPSPLEERAPLARARWGQESGAGRQSLVSQSSRRPSAGSTTPKGRARGYLSSVPFVTVHLACGLALVYPLIEANGFAAVGAHSGGEALAQLGSGLACCIIVLDWWLPDMTGGDFIRALHATPALADIPVATCTDDARMRAEAAALGVTYVLLKPVDPRSLVTLVSHHCPQAPSAPAASN